MHGPGSGIGRELQQGDPGQVPDHPDPGDGRRAVGIDLGQPFSTVPAGQPVCSQRM
jgi:hypothetical protein